MPRRSIRDREVHAQSDDERARLLARSYQWLTSSQRRRLAVLDARAVAERYPWIARTEAARHASKEDAGGPR